MSGGESDNIEVERIPLEKSKFDSTGDSDFIDSMTVAEHNKIYSFSSQMNITKERKKRKKGRTAKKKQKQKEQLIL